MKKTMKFLILITVALLPAFSHTTHAQEQTDYSHLSYDELITAAEGTTVNFYGWGGDEELNRWLDEEYAPVLLEKYKITLNRVPMDIDQVLSQLLNEQQAEAAESPIDMIWINGENFRTARENNLLYGPFTDQLPNYQEYIDAEDPENQYDFGYPIDGYEAPYSKAQLVFIKDGAVTEESPQNAQELLEFAQANPGLVTYPALPDFTGSAVVRNIIYEFVSYEEFQNMEADKEVVLEAILPALDYLVELNEYLWNGGSTYPTDSPALNNMFMDGEVLFHQTYGAYDITSSIRDGSYPDTAETFIFENGTIGNTSFIAIGKMSQNIAGAMVAINEMLSPEMQLSKYEQLAEIPVLDNSRLSEEQQAAFDAVDLGPGTIPQDELLEHRLPEMPAALVPIIEEIWLEEVAGQ